MIFSWLQVCSFFAVAAVAGWVIFPDEFMRGRMYRDQADRAESILHFRRFLDAHPGHKSATLELAAAYEAAGRPEEAVEPLLALYRSRRGDPVTGQAVLELMDRSQGPAKADAFRWELIEDMRASPQPGKRRLEETLYEAFERAAAAQDDERTLQALAMLSGISSDGPSYREKIIALLLSRHLLDRALAVVRDQTRSDPKNPELRRMTARILNARGDEPAALAEIESALSAFRFNTGLLADRVHLHVLAKRWPKAEADLRSLMRIEPKNDEWPSTLARSYMAMGRLAEAIAIFDQVLARSPSDRARWWDAIFALSDNGRHEEAAARLERFLARFPGDPEALDLLVYQRQQTGRNDLAISALKRRIKAVPGDAARRRALASLLTEDEQLEEAAEQIEAVVALAPWDSAAWLDAASLYESLHDDKAAAALYERYLKRFPDDGKAMEKLAGIYMNLGQRDKAIALLQGHFKARAGGSR